MDANTLCQLVDAKFEALSQLTELSEHQVATIDENRMSDLMRILSQKQKLIEQLLRITDQLMPALQDDPLTRVWESEDVRQQCRDRQQQCEQMHLQLLAIEAQCEATLQASRSDMEEQLGRLNSGQQAAAGYSRSQAYGQTNSSGSSSGARLDLSSN
ncbi:FlgN protein [Rubripirellula amarantea]|uniref:FlgN protein n=1 Tax=Rubripirellula amarantea TaxID=2527999 RepID=A0A5C5WS63_9BACT|nr:flagellar export chaperone FlgN [Rubripirellula amarantea]TWT53001.1 FlgN protein [Rubripirellula amarantea]